ncbi:aldehyde dehydrogenase family protein [Amycolatopsis sp. NPDC059027]|uniref:aldehyde dehydrogenase family protein n=1 Tax=Amycolatopsis sp. NPDC059027 TaxID=3346709 RepID=UPI00366FD132
MSEGTVSPLGLTAELTSTVDGAAGGHDGEFGVIGPATGRVFAMAPETTPEALDAAVAAADRTFRTEWRTDDDVRRGALGALAETLADSADDLAALLSAEQGKSLPDALDEVAVAARYAQYYAENPAEREALGPIAVITQWSFPLSIAFASIAPALRSGGTVVWKPSPHAPLSALMAGELLRLVLPPGVLNVVSGSDPLGARLVAHPLVREVGFTGSVATGKKVVAAADTKRLTLDLSGNDPVLVLDDADPGRVAGEVFAAAFRNLGQVCVGPKRVYVPASLQQAFVEALTELARTAEHAELAPVGTRQQFDRVVDLVADARAHRAVVTACGSQLDRPGYFAAPAILADVTDGVRVVDEDQFGPVLPVITYTDVDDAIKAANASPYRLGASVFGADPGRAAAVAGRLEAGAVWIGSHGTHPPEDPGRSAG